MEIFIFHFLLIRMCNILGIQNFQINLTHSINWVNRFLKNEYKLVRGFITIRKGGNAGISATEGFYLFLKRVTCEYRRDATVRG